MTQNQIHNKRGVALLFLLLLMVYSSCSTPDLEELRRRLDDHESRLTKIERVTDQANQEVQALKQLLKALSEKKMVNSYRPLDDGSGYVLTFSDGSTIKLTNGRDGVSSEVNVRVDPTDGIYYWTLNGSWILDPNGHKIQAQGIDGTAGVTPLLRVSSAGYWEYSLDGKTWHLIETTDGEPVKASGGIQESQLDITETDSAIVIRFKGQTFTIPKGGSAPVDPNQPAAPTITLDGASAREIEVGGTLVIKVKLDPATTPLEKVTWTSSHAEVATVEAGGIVHAVAAGETTITATVEGGNSVSCIVTVKAPAMKEMTFKLKVHDLHAVSALFDVTPSETDRTYYTAITDKANWDQIGGVDGIFEYDKKWFGSSGAEWKTVLDQFLVKGAKTNLPSNEVGAGHLKPDTEYVFYAYGLTPEGEMSSEVTFITFTTPKQVRKDLSFEIKVEDVLTNGIIASITPSNNELQYIVAIVRDSYGRFYSKREDLKESGAWKLINDESIRVTGKYIISPESKDKEKYETMLPGMKYWIVVFGYDEDGITTEVTYYPFNTKKRES